MCLEETTMLDVDELMTPAQAAQELRCGLDEVRELVKAGELPTVRVPLGLLLERAAVEALAEERKSAPAS